MSTTTPTKKRSLVCPDAPRKARVKNPFTPSGSTPFGPSGSTPSSSNPFGPFTLFGHRVAEIQQLQAQLTQSQQENAQLLSQLATIRAERDQERERSRALSQIIIGAAVQLK